MGWQVQDDIDVGELWRKNVPEVFVISLSSVKITPEIRALIKGINPGMTVGELNSLLKSDRAFTNNGSHSIDKIRVCGRAILNGSLTKILVKKKLVDALVVNTINANKKLPSPEEVIEKGLYFECFIVKADGSLIPFPQNKATGHVYFPLISRIPPVVQVFNRVPGKPIPWLLPV